MDIIEIIIGLLVIGVPVIFKLIGRSLEKSGSETAGQFKKIAGVFEDESEQDDSFGDVTVTYEMPEEMPSQMQPEVQKSAKPVMPVASAKPKKTVLLEEEAKKGEKIDPKKLVIYSEIMKPKY